MSTVPTNQADPPSVTMTVRRLLLLLGLLFWSLAGTMLMALGAFSLLSMAFTLPGLFGMLLALLDLLLPLPLLRHGLSDCLQLFLGGRVQYRAAMLDFLPQLLHLQFKFRRLVRHNNFLLRLGDVQATIDPHPRCIGT